MTPHWKNLSLDDIDGEFWKPLKDYESRYMASNFGRIKTLKYQQKYHKILVQRINEDGYLDTGLRKERSAKQKRRLVHRLIGFTFHENPENKPEINHLDFDKTNNVIDNIIWATYLENRIHAIEGGKAGLKEITAFNSNENIKFESIMACARHFNRTKGEIYSRINRNKMYDSFFFVCPHLKDRPILTKIISRPVIAANHETSISFTSIAEAAKHFNRDKKNFKKRIGKGKLYDGYIFSYAPIPLK